MGTEENKLGERAPQVGASDSSRLDWLSLSYFAASLSLQREQISFALELHKLLSGTYEMAQGGGRRFFEESWYHDDGVALKWTEPSGQGVNKGLLSIDLKGAALAALPALVRKSLYLDLIELEGFKQCTRMDMQRTITDPLADAQEIYQLVLNKEVWVKGFSSYGQGSQVDADGRPVNGCTIDWGSRKGTTQCKTYDKRAELGGEGPPAVRHEQLLRKQPARDRFLSLCAGLELEGETDDTRYEDLFTKANLNQTMTYLDTSRLKDVPRKDWPVNWARDSSPADFWSQVVEGEVEEFTTKWRYETTLERLIKNRAKQYGRGRCKWVALRLFRDGEELADVVQDDFDLDFIRMRDEDLDEVLAQVPDERKEECAIWMRDCRRIAAGNIEHHHNA